MKILIITESFRIGGKERRLVELLKQFDIRNDIECKVVLLKNLIEFKEVFSFKNIPIIIFHRKIKKDPIVFIRLFSLIRQYKPEIIHSWGTMPSVYSFPLAKFFRIKFINAMIANVSCKPFSKTWFRAKITFPFSDVIVSNSYAGLRAYKVNQKKGFMIRNGYDFKRQDRILNPEDVLRSYAIHDKFIVGMIGVFHKRKDFGTFFSAAKEIIKEFEDIYFFAVGGGEDFITYKNKLTEDQKQKIIMPGYCENVESIIGIFDIAVLTSHSEGISNAIIEYMAQGKAVIATRNEGTEELITDGQTGILIDPYDVHELKSEIIRLYKNHDLRNELGVNAKKLIIQDFSIESMVNKTMGLYKSLVS